MALPLTGAVVSQVVAEVLRQAGAADVRVSQVVAEVLRDGAPGVRASQVVVEVLYPADAVASWQATPLAAWHEPFQPGPTSGAKSTTLPASAAWALVLIAIPPV